MAHCHDGEKSQCLDVTQGGDEEILTTVVGRSCRRSCSEQVLQSEFFSIAVLDAFEPGGCRHGRRMPSQTVTRRTSSYQATPRATCLVTRYITEPLAGPRSAVALLAEAFCEGVLLRLSVQQARSVCLSLWKASAERSHLLGKCQRCACSLLTVLLHPTAARTVCDRLMHKARSSFYPSTS